METNAIGRQSADDSSMERRVFGTRQPSELTGTAAGPPVPGPAAAPAAPPAVLQGGAEGAPGALAPPAPSAP